jgi:uncharacterized lipoprotein YajG
MEIDEIYREIEAGVLDARDDHPEASVNDIINEVVNSVLIGRHADVVKEIKRRFGVA